MLLEIIHYIKEERRERAQAMSDLNGMLHEGDTISTPPQNGTF